MSRIQKDVSLDVFDKGPKAYRGYTLFSPVGGTEVYLIDMKGRPIHTWRMPFEIGSHGVLLPNGNLLCAVTDHEEPLADFDGVAGSLLEMDWDSNVVWRYDDPYMHHDFHRMPNGNTILLRWVPTPNDIACKVKGGLPDTEREKIMWSDSIREINPAGKVVWEWLGYEHLDPEIDKICPLCFRNEWTHANSFIVTPYGDILASFMKTNTIAIINKENGDITWRWGGFLTLAHPHDVSLLDNGDVMVLGCGIHLAGMEAGYSEILQIETKNNNIVWEFREYSVVDFYTPCKGSLQRLPNGNTLICEGDTGRIFELTEGKEIVWEYVNPFYQTSPIYGRNNMLFGVYRYGHDYQGLKGNAPKATKPAMVPQEKGMPEGKKLSTSKEQVVHDRLGSLGY